MSTPPSSFSEEFGKAPCKSCAPCDSGDDGTASLLDAQVSIEKICPPMETAVAFSSRFDEERNLGVARSPDDKALDSSLFFEDTPLLLHEPTLEGKRKTENVVPYNALPTRPMKASDRAFGKDKKKLSRVPVNDLDKLACHVKFRDLYELALKVDNATSSIFGDAKAYSLFQKHRPPQVRGALEVLEIVAGVIGLKERFESQQFDTIPLGMSPIIDAFVEENLSTLHSELDTMKQALLASEEERIGLSADEGAEGGDKRTSKPGIIADNDAGRGRKTEVVTSESLGLVSGAVDSETDFPNLESIEPLPIDCSDEHHFVGSEWDHFLDIFGM